jgi:ATP-dependent DNA helicase 2 subunit 2
VIYCSRGQPDIKADWECLFFNKLPFSEDIRQYTFPSLLENAPDSRKAWVPTQEQLDAAEDIINSMDLMVAGTDDDGCVSRWLF